MRSQMYLKGFSFKCWNKAWKHNRTSAWDHRGHRMKQDGVPAGPAARTQQETKPGLHRRALLHISQSFSSTTTVLNPDPALTTIGTADTSTGPFKRPYRETDFLRDGHDQPSLWSLVLSARFVLVLQWRHQRPPAPPTPTPAVSGRKWSFHREVSLGCER